MTDHDAPIVVDGVARQAYVSENGAHRYSLRRDWQAAHGGRGRVLFVMLNPSTADGREDDPTIKRCIGFARSWGYGSLEVGNLFAYRATKPTDLAKAAAAGIDTVGPTNDRWLDLLAERADLIVAAWGAQPIGRQRETEVLELLRRRGPAYSLGLTRGGYPLHPLYLLGTIVPQPLEAT